MAHYFIDNCHLNYRGAVRKPDRGIVDLTSSDYGFSNSQRASGENWE
jgi:hypothetical protein